MFGEASQDDLPRLAREERTERVTMIDGLFDSLETRLTHQFWQFLGVIVAFGAAVIAVLRLA